MSRFLLSFTSLFFLSSYLLPSLFFSLSFLFFASSFLLSCPSSTFILILIQPLRIFSSSSASLSFPLSSPFSPFSSPLLSSLHTPGRKAFVFYLHNKGGCCARSSEEPGKRNILILTLHLLYLLPRLCLYHLHHFVSSLSSLYFFTLLFSLLPFNNYSFIIPYRLFYLHSSHLSLHVLFLS